jgi:hypothetical protein
VLLLEPLSDDEPDEDEDDELSDDEVDDVVLSLDDEVDDDELLFEPRLSFL